MYNDQRNCQWIWRQDHLYGEEKNVGESTKPWGISGLITSEWYSLIAKKKMDIQCEGSYYINALGYVKCNNLNVEGKRFMPEISRSTVLEIYTACN